MLITLSQILLPFMCSYLTLISCQDNAICVTKKSCSECIKTGPSCAWTDSFEFNGDRCQTESNLLALRDADAIKIKSMKQTPKSKIVDVIESPEVSFVTQQMFPFKYKLQMRRGDTIPLQIKYKQLIDYPVDLYFLIDNSKTMQIYKKRLADIMRELSESLQRITKDYTIGFGSFVDKPLAPFTEPLQDVYKNKICENRDFKCIPTYSFKNHLKLGKDVNKFINTVTSLDQSINIDSPEGGLDALMQVMVCDERIGWRPNSTKIILFATDGSFHLAGDGKLAGIVTPNDGKCHLDANDENYLAYDKYDYPSINQISMTSLKHSMNIIFAVSDFVYPIYAELSNQTELSSVALLSRDASNLYQLIVDQYSKITSQIKLIEKKFYSSSAEIKYVSSTCRYGDMKDASVCNGIKTGNEATFHIQLKVNQCEEGGNTINITLGNQVNQRVIIEYSTLCKCNCEEAESIKINSSLCGHQGNLGCGICDCYNGFLGKKCECSLEELGNPNSGSRTVNESILTDPCRKSGDDSICSSHGTCHCGSCTCNKGYHGQYCECGDNDCDRFNGKVCAGNGRCFCGKCICNTKTSSFSKNDDSEQILSANWIGDTCSCLNETFDCFPPPTLASLLPDGNDGSGSDINGKGTKRSLGICSGRGTCQCNVCSCNSGSEGKYCEECPDCQETCAPMIRHVIDAWNENFKTVNISIFNAEAKESSNKSSFLSENSWKPKIIFVENLRVGKDDKKCSTTQDENNCIIEFKYKKLERKNKDSNQRVDEIYVLKKKTCPEKLSPLKVGMNVGVGIIAVGLLTAILWRLITFYHDRAEYERFKKELDAAKWQGGQNPMYKPSTSLFPNPAYTNDRQ